LNSSGKERRESFLFSKACKSLYRRRFREFEDAPLAAYNFDDVSVKCEFNLAAEA
jgi:hypothetical protein